MLLKFILVIGIAAITVTVASILWPRLTRNPRPEPLAKVHSVVMNTQLGEQAADFLGVNNESQFEPINVASVAGALTTRAIQSVQEKAGSIIATQAMQQLVNQFENLSDDQKEQLKEAICKE